MNHLATYKIFESKEEFELRKEEIMSDIKTICYDITDDGRFGIAFGKKTISPARIQQGVVTRPTKSIYYVYIGVRTNSWSAGDDGFDISEVKDVLLRIRNYLGDRYVGATLLPIGESQRVDMRGYTSKSFEDITLTNIYIDFWL